MAHPAPDEAPTDGPAPAAAPVVGLVYDDRYLQHDPGLELHWGSWEPYPFVDPIPHAVGIMSA